MAFPKRLLHTGEEVFVDQRPHPLRLAYPATVSLVVVGGLAAAFIAWGNAPLWFGAFWAFAFVCTTGYFLSRLWRWRSTSFVVTSHRVIYRSGVLRREGREIPIDAVQSVAYSQGLFARLVRLGTIKITSAGENDEQNVPDIRDPELVQMAIHAALEAGMRRRYGTITTPSPLSGATAVPADAGPSVPNAPAEIVEAIDVRGELRRLDVLFARGVITEEEFAMAREELLGDGGEDGLA